MLKMALGYATTDDEWQHALWTCPIADQQKEFWEKQAKNGNYFASCGLFYLAQTTGDTETRDMLSGEVKDMDDLLQQKPELTNHSRKKLVEVYKKYLVEEEAPQTVGQAWAQTCAWHYMIEEAIKTKASVSRDAALYAQGMFMAAYAMTLPLVKIETDEYAYSAKDLFYKNKHIAKSQGMNAFAQFKKIAEETELTFDFVRVLRPLIEEGPRI